MDITAQIGATWSAVFFLLEFHHGLDINNPNHIWLLHYLFLGHINSALVFFAESWNRHTLQIRGRRDRSPIDMFSFDMLTCGVRGVGILTDVMSNDELEIYGVDWEALQDDQILESVNRGINTIGEENTSWVGQVGPPARLSEVLLDSPENPLTVEESTELHNEVGHLLGNGSDEEIITTWVRALAVVRSFGINGF